MLHCDYFVVSQALIPQETIYDFAVSDQQFSQRPRLASPLQHMSGEKANSCGKLKYTGVRPVLSL